MKIVILDGYTLNPGDITWDEFKSMGDVTIYDRTTPEEVVERANRAEVIAVNKVQITEDILNDLPDLKCILVLATGYDCVDIKSAASRKIAVCNVPIYGTDSVAEFVMALILEMSRHPYLHNNAVKNGDWTSSPDWCFWKQPLIELSDKTIGIIGFGRIGRRVGELANAFKMRVMAHDIYHGNEPAYKSFSWASMDEIFESSDYITLHCNQTEDNKGFINKQVIGKMKNTAFLINTSRGGLITEHDLATALNSNLIAGAAIDVVSMEPIREDNPLLNAKNIILTPHIAWATREARQRLMKIVAENLAAFLKGHPQNVVN